MSRAGTRRTPVLLALAAFATVALLNVPVLYLFVRASADGPARWLEIAGAPTTLRFAWDTLLLVAGVVPLTLAIALPLAWLVTRSDLPLRGLVGALAALPLAVPSYIAAFALIALAGPRGLAWRAVAGLGVERLPELAYGYSGAALALALYTYPYVYLPAVAALAGVDPAHAEAARSLGRTRWAAWRSVTLPRLIPALGGGGLLVAFYTLSDFGAVSLLRYNTLTLGIWHAYAGLFDRTVAAALSTVLVVLTLALLVLAGWTTARERPARATPARRRAPARLGPWRLPLSIAVWSFLALTLGMPLGVSFLGAARAVGEGIPLSTVAEATWGSIAVSVAAAAWAPVLALPIALWAVRRPGPASRATERLAWTGNALPGIVTALALVFAATRWAPVLYQTLALVVAAYLLRFLPQALAAVRGALVRVAPAWEEAARGLGRSRLGVLRTITLPILRPGLAAGAGLVFLTAMKELPATLVLRPIGFETLATRVWTSTADGAFSEAAVPALVLLLASGLPVYLLVIRPSIGARA